MLVLKEGVQGINIQDLNAMYKSNLAGTETGRLSDAFDWNKTPEGYQFWSFINGIARVVPEIDKVKEELQVLPDSFRASVERELQKVNRNKSKSLRFSFKWGESPQGEAYWKLVSDMIRFHTTGQAGEPEAFDVNAHNGTPSGRGIRVIKKAKLNPPLAN